MTRQPTPSILDDVLTTDASRPATIRNDAIKIDGGTQMRAQLDAATVDEYADTMAEAGWGKFPPIIAYYDGTDYWLADGFHRLAAFRSLADYSDALIPADVRSGTRRDAILHAAGANASHGLRRTNADKRRAVETLLRDEEWAKWSNREIARRCAVAESSVRNIRSELERTAQIAQSDERHGGDGRTTNTANIGVKHSYPIPNVPKPTDAEWRAAVRDIQRNPDRFVLHTDNLPDDLVDAGWTVRSKDLGSYWVVNETHGMESAIVRNWDGFVTLCASLQKRLPSHAETVASAIRAAVQAAPDELLAPPSEAPLPMNGYASQSQIEDWLTEIPATSAQLLEAAETLSGPIWNQLEHLAAGEGYELSIATPKAALRNAASQAAFEERKTAKSDDRINRARILINHYAELCDACERALERESEYEALVGQPSDLLAAHRGMHAIVDTLHEPIAKLEHLIETLISAKEAA